MKTSQTKAEIQSKALHNAVTGESLMNYETIIVGFVEKGIAIDDIAPRENVFTFNAWKALGRVVKKGEHGVKVVTWVPCTKKDNETGEEATYNKPHTTTVFHLSQTDAIN